MEKATGTMLVVLVIGALIGAGSAYYYVQPQIKDAFAQGAAYQQSIDTQGTTGVAPDLVCEWDDDEFDHAATVDVDGNVAADTDKSNSITITNDGDTDANSVWISLYNPVKDKYGLDEDLELDDVKVSIAYGGLSKITLYKDGEYTDGYEIGTIPAGSEVEIEITFTLLEHDDGDFTDGKTLDCELYIYGAGASAAEECEFTVLT